MDEIRDKNKIKTFYYNIKTWGFLHFPENVVFGSIIFLQKFSFNFVFAYDEEINQRRDIILMLSIAIHLKLSYSPLMINGSNFLQNISNV